MSAKELLLWRADYSIKPWGDERADLRAGSIVQSNLQPWSKQPVKLSDCVLRFKQKAAQTMEEMKNILMALTLRMGGKVVKRGDDKHTGG